MSVKPEKLSRMPFNPIACYGMPNFPGDGDTKARSLILAGRIRHDKIPISNGFSFFGQQNKRSAIPDSIGLGKRKSVQKPLFL
jgi:hypothetical protein